MNFSFGSIEFLPEQVVILGVLLLYSILPSSRKTFVSGSLTLAMFSSACASPGVFVLGVLENAASRCFLSLSLPFRSSPTWVRVLADPPPLGEDFFCSLSFWICSLA